MVAFRNSRMSNLQAFNSRKFNEGELKVMNS